MTGPDQGPLPEPGEARTSGIARGAAGGNRADLEALYSRVAPALHTWATLRLRAEYRAHFEPEDLVQEVWFRALSLFDRYDPDRPFRAWIFRVAKNVLLEWFRRLHRSQKDRIVGTPSDDLHRLHREECPGTAISRRVARDEDLKRFIASLEGLEEADREVLIYCGLEGRTAREVGVLLDLSAETVAKRWQRLRSRLEEQGLHRRLEELLLPIR